MSFLTIAYEAIAEGLTQAYNEVNNAFSKLGGLQCSGGIVTRYSERKCDPGWAYSHWDPLNIGLCYENCKGNYETRPYDVTSCWNKTPLVLPITDVKFPTCGEDRENIDGLCYYRCYMDGDTKKEQLRHVPGAPYQCMGSRGLHYFTKTSPVLWQGKGSYEATCGERDVTEDKIDENGNVTKVIVMAKDKNGNIVKDASGNPIPVREEARVRIASLCYRKCSDVYGSCYIQAPGAGLFCTPKKGYSYIPPLADPACPKSYSFDGVTMCRNNYIPNRYTKPTTELQCPDGHDNVLGLCYKKCPTIDVNVNGVTKTIQLGKIPGGLGFCSPPHNGGFKISYQPAGSPIFFPGIYTKIRKAGYSTK